LLQGHAELYRGKLSNQWQNLQRGLGWPGANCDGSVKRCRETKNSSESAAHDQEDQSPIDTETESSSSLWASCPIVLRDQVAYVFQALEGQRLQMEDLYERIAELERTYEGEDSS